MTDKTQRNMEAKEAQEADSVLHVATKAQNVSINMKGVEQIAAEAMIYMIHNYDNRNFGEVVNKYVRLSSEFHPDKYDKRAADWLFVLNTLNFSLWTRNDAHEWKVDGLTGYLALCAAIKRAIDNGKPMWDPNFYTKLTLAEMTLIFRGDNNKIIPFVFRRLAILQKVGEILLKNYNGTFAECIKSCKRDAEKLVIIIHDKFPSYHDVSKYDQLEVPLYNKAWILVADILAFFNLEHELGIEMKIMKFSTIFADYRVTQVFNHFNALVYNKNFLDKFKKNEKLLLYGSKEELEIRCCSLMIIRHLHKLMIDKCKLTKRIPKLILLNFDFTYLLDNFLWDYRQTHDAQLKKSVLFKICSEQY